MRAELAARETQEGVPRLTDPASVRAGAPRRRDFHRARHDPHWPDPPGVRSPAELKRYMEVVASRDREAVCVGGAHITGIELALRYVDGCLRQAILRGDGDEGNDVRDNARTIGSVPF